MKFLYLIGSLVVTLSASAYASTHLTVENQLEYTQEGGLKSSAQYLPVKVEVIDGSTSNSQVLSSPKEPGIFGLSASFFKGKETGIHRVSFSFPNNKITGSSDKAPTQWGDVAPPFKDQTFSLRIKTTNGVFHCTDIKQTFTAAKSGKKLTLSSSGPCVIVK